MKKITIAISILIVSAISYSFMGSNEAEIPVLRKNRHRNWRLSSTIEI